VGGTRGRRRKRSSLFGRSAFWLLSSSRKRIDGLWVATGESKADCALVWRRVEGALCLIKTYDRRRYDRLLRDLERLWVRVSAYGFLGCHNASINACELDTRFVLAESTSPEIIASTIVHEATHARLWRCGIDYEERLRARVEAVCMRSEIAFAAKLPNGREAREQAERALELCVADANWTDAAFDARHIEGAMEAMRYLGMPNWFTRTLPRLHALSRPLRELRRSWRRSRRAR
jgi:hypothetical protein